MSQQTFNALKVKPPLQHVTTKVFAYGSDNALELIGVFETDIKYKERTVSATFLIAKTGTQTLLSYDTASDLGLIKIVFNIADEPERINHTEIMQKYADRFQGIGKLKDVTCKLHVDETVNPVTQPHRRIPFHVRNKVKEDLHHLEELDVIEKVVDQPTPWISPIRVVPKPKKPGEIRICVDMRAVNKAIIRERHVTPTIDDIIAKLSNSTVFSKLDLNSGYHQVELAEESRYLTVFATHVGLYRYKRLNFGVNSAAECFQNLIQSALAGLDGVLNMSDDIIVFGEDASQHDQRLDACLLRLRERNLTLNKDKCEFQRSTIEYFGHIFSAEGIAPSPAKVKSLKEAAHHQPPRRKSAAS